MLCFHKSLLTDLKGMLTEFVIKRRQSMYLNMKITDITMAFLM